MEIVGKDERILSVTENGYGKRTPISKYRLQSRAGRGVINFKVTERSGKVVGVLSIGKESEIMVISSNGKISRLDSKQIRSAGRSTQGVRVMRLGEGDRVAAVCTARRAEGLNGSGKAD
jgi:DNA gyrase subunit A